MSSYLEHIQYVSRDLEKTTDFYCYVFGWKLRGRGTERAADRTYDWVHIGTDDTYVAFRSPYDGAAYSEDLALRQTHIGIVIDDLPGTIARLDQIECEYRPKGRHPHRYRMYVRDPDGNEIEIIHYRSENPDERNDYEIDG